MIERGSIWRSLGSTRKEFGKYCVVKEVNDDPVFNGDGDIELLFSDGSRLYTKVRRFRGAHKFIKNGRR